LAYKSIGVKTLTFQDHVTVRDVNGHMTIWLPGDHFLQALHCHQVAISLDPFSRQ